MSRTVQAAHSRRRHPGEAANVGKHCHGLKSHRDAGIERRFVPLPSAHPDPPAGSTGFLPTPMAPHPQNVSRAFQRVVGRLRSEGTRPPGRVRCPVFRRRCRMPPTDLGLKFYRSSSRLGSCSAWARFYRCTGSGQDRTGCAQFLFTGPQSPGVPRRTLAAAVNIRSCSNTKLEG